VRVIGKNNELRIWQVITANV